MMSDEMQLVVGVVVTGAGLLTALVGWLIVRRRLRAAPAISATVVSKKTTRASRWRQPEHEYAWNRVNDHWVSVIPGIAVNETVGASGQEELSGSPPIDVRVPGTVFRRAQPGTQLDLVATIEGLRHPYYRVRWIVWGFGVIAAVLVINGVSLFFTDDVQLPTWLQ